MSSINNIEQAFEELIANLAIPEHQERIYRHAILHMINLINGELAGRMIFSKSLFDEIHEPLFLETSFYGGSFDRHTNIKGASDIDVYFIYSLRNYRSYLGLAGFSRDLLRLQLKIDDITGELLFNKLVSQLKKLEQNSIMYSGYNLPVIEIIRHPPYRHAIPIKVKHKGIGFNVDCIPALKVNNQNYLVIPDFDNVVKVNPTKDENALSNINRKHDGKPTKLIRLIKLWNKQNGHELKSYLIERLVEKVFVKKPMSNWTSTIKTFFQEAIYILRNRKMIENKVYTHKSILDEYSEVKIKKMIITLQNAVRFAQVEQWDKLFNVS